MRLGLLARLEKFISPEPFSGCWLWMGVVGKSGYGKIGIDGTNIGAHRVVYRLLVGDIPVGKELDHLCRVRCCVNPKHLEAVTHSENVKRGLAREIIRAFNASKTNCPQGHPYTDENTYRFRPTFRRCRVCDRDRHRASYWRDR